MKIKNLFYLPLLMLLLAGCSSDKTSSNTGIDSKLTAKEIVDKNLFIDFTLDDIKESRSTKVSPRAFAPYRAARYRFERSITRGEDNICVTSAKCGADLNMNEDLFNFFLRDMEWLNEQARKYPGAKVGLRDEAFFNRVLNDADGSIMKADTEKARLEAEADLARCIEQKKMEKRVAEKQAE